MSAAGRTRRSKSTAARLAWRAALLLAVVLTIAFAVQGGEYTTAELLSRTQRRAELEQEVEQLQRVVDSLTREKRLVETDDATLERIAREEYGMVKGSRELLYRFAEERDDDTLPRR